MPEAVLQSHITLDDRGVAWIKEANTKVTEIAMDTLAHGWSPEEIVYQHPHLTLAQVHAALAYYYDHQFALDAQMQESLENCRRLREESLPTSPIRRRLRGSGYLLD